MVILVVLFILMFAFSLAALVMSQQQQYQALKTGWANSRLSTKRDLQKLGDCCGFEDKNVIAGNMGHPSCVQVGIIKL